MAPHLFGQVSATLCNDEAPDDHRNGADQDHRGYDHCVQQQVLFVAIKGACLRATLQIEDPLGWLRVQRDVVHVGLQLGCGTDWGLLHLQLAQQEQELNRGDVDPNNRHKFSIGTLSAILG